MKKFRFAILGAGHIARQFCDAVSRIDGCEVCAVASKSLARAENFAKRMVLKAIMMIMRCYWRKKDQIVPILQ